MIFHNIIKHQNFDPRKKLKNIFCRHDTSRKMKNIARGEENISHTPHRPHLDFIIRSPKAVANFQWHLFNSQTQRRNWHIPRRTSKWGGREKLRRKEAWEKSLRENFRRCEENLIVMAEGKTETNESVSLRCKWLSAHSKTSPRIQFNIWPFSYFLRLQSDQGHHFHFSIFTPQPF